jgi:dTDP-4-amino-4,6-dideoxygalactose transaminase
MPKEIIPLNTPYLAGDEWQLVKKCFDTNWVSSAGPAVNEFADKFSRYVGSSYAVALSSGTAAIHIALRTLGVGEGDSVLVPSLTFIASVNPIRYVNAEPVFVDSRRDTFNVDHEELILKAKQMLKRGHKPKAIIVVHLYGHSVYMEPLVNFCKENNIYLIEDATEALGTKYFAKGESASGGKGKFVGTIGDIGCFSFNGNKIITTGGGGMISTDNKKWAEKASYYSQQARDNSFEFVHNDIGYNYRISNIQAAFGIAQLSHINEFIAKKKEIASWYKNGLEGIKGITLNPLKSWCDNNYWLYSILVEQKLFGVDARTLCKAMNKVNIESRPFFKPIHTMPMYKKCDATDMSDSIWLWERGLSLPSSVGLEKKQVQKVIGIIKDFAHKKT